MEKFIQVAVGDRIYAINPYRVSCCEYQDIAPKPVLIIYFGGRNEILNIGGSKAASVWEILSAQNQIVI